MFRKLFGRLSKVFWLLPGFLLWASYPPMGETADCLFALAPLLWLTRTADVRAVVSAGTRALANPADYSARADLMWAGTLAHNNVCGEDIPLLVANLGLRGNTLGAFRPLGEKEVAAILRTYVK